MTRFIHDAALAIRQAFAYASVCDPGPNLPVVLIPERQWPEFVTRAKHDSLLMETIETPCDRYETSFDHITIYGIRFVCADDRRMNEPRPLALMPLEEVWGDDCIYASDGSIGGEKHWVPSLPAGKRGAARNGGMECA